MCLSGIWQKFGLSVGQHYEVIMSVHSLKSISVLIWHSRLVGYWSFTSWQRLRSYQDGYQPLTVHTHSDFIVLSHWKISPWAPISWHGANQSLPYPTNAERQTRKQQISIFKSAVWLDQGSKPSMLPRRKTCILTIIPSCKQLIHTTLLPRV